MKKQIKENKELVYSFLCLLTTYAIWLLSAYAVTPLYGIGPRMSLVFVVLIYATTLLLSIYAVYLCVMWGIKKPSGSGQRKFLGFIPNIKMSVFSIFFIILVLINIWVLWSVYIERVLYF
jgi:hypothetical protein